MTVLAFFIVSAYKGLVLGRSKFRGGLGTLTMGAGAAGLAYLLGRVPQVADQNDRDGPQKADVAHR